MAVITRYVVVRDGVELDQVFTVKKEAEAYDKMLDAADRLAEFIKSSALDVALEDRTIEAVAIVLAQNGPEVVKILKGIKPIVPPSETGGAAGAGSAPPSGAKKPAKPASAKRRTP